MEGKITDCNHGKIDEESFTEGYVHELAEDLTVEECKLSCSKTDRCVAFDYSELPMKPFEFDRGALTGKTFNNGSCVKVFNSPGEKVEFKRDSNHKFTRTRAFYVLGSNHEIKELEDQSLEYNASTQIDGKDCFELTVEPILAGSSDFKTVKEFYEDKNNSLQCTDPSDPESMDKICATNA